MRVYATTQALGCRQQWYSLDVRGTDCLAAARDFRRTGGDYASSGWCPACRQAVGTGVGRRNAVGVSADAAAWRRELDPLRWACGENINLMSSLAL